MSKSVLTCLLATTATVWLAVAIAQTIAPNNMLTAAGFVAKYPDTPEKQEIFNSLPPNRLVKRAEERQGLLRLRRSWRMRMCLCGLA